MAQSVGLKRYQQAKRDAKRLGGDYEKYVNHYYSVSKKLRTKGVKIKETGARILTPEEFEINKASEGTKTPKLVAEQFGLLTGKQARNLQSALKEMGFDISVSRASTRQLSRTEWNKIDEFYHDRIAGGDSAEQAKLTISQYFFGS